MYIHKMNIKSQVTEYYTVDMEIRVSHQPR